MKNQSSTQIVGGIKIDPSFYEIISMVLLVGFCVFTIRGTFILGLKTTSPLMGVKSGSMEHEDESWRSFYESKGYEASEFPFQSGIQKGNLVLVKGVDSLNDIEIGDVIVWKYGNDRTIHRVWDMNENKGYITTKGDANNGLVPGEQMIPLKNVVGKAIISAPYLGYPAVWFDIYGKR